MMTVAVAIRTGVEIIEEQTCLNCSDRISADGLHGLRCQKGVSGRAARHKGLNDVFFRTLKSIDCNSRLEPEYIWNGKKPDGVTILPWKEGKRLIWDVTCSDSFAPTYRRCALSGSGEVARAAEIRKFDEYKGLMPKYMVQPIAFETLGAYGPSTMAFIQDIGRILIRFTGDVRAASFLRQRISVEIQRANAWSIIESLRQGVGLKEMDHLDLLEDDEC
jgi:hypothetical protein